MQEKQSLLWGSLLIKGQHYWLVLASNLTVRWRRLLKLLVENMRLEMLWEQFRETLHIFRAFYYI